MKKAYRVKPSDNVAVLLQDVEVGENVVLNHGDDDNDAIACEIIALNPVRAGHKIALTDLERNENVIKYGEVIGFAISQIKTGEHIHVHNLGGLRGRGDIS